MKIEKKQAFTLAETLITLGIIGVVAALSLPALFDAWDNQKQAAARKKAMYTLANGYKKLATDNEVSMSNSPLFQCGENFSCLSNLHKKSFSIASDKTKSHEGLPDSYVRSDSDTEEAGFKWDDVPYIFTTADGMTFGYLSGTKSGGIEIAVDMNGVGEPNKICEDVFKVVIDNKGGVTTTYKDGDKDQDLCSKLNDSLKGCTADTIKDSTICDAAGLANLYNNAGQPREEQGAYDAIYIEADVMYRPRFVCTSDGKVFAISNTAKEWNSAGTEFSYEQKDDYSVEEVSSSYAKYCP